MLGVDSQMFVVTRNDRKKKAFKKDGDTVSKQPPKGCEKPGKLMGFQLPSPQLVSLPDFFHPGIQCLKPIIFGICQEHQDILREHDLHIWWDDDLP